MRFFEKTIKKKYIGSEGIILIVRHNSLALAKWFSSSNYLNLRRRFLFSTSAHTSALNNWCIGLL